MVNSVDQTEIRHKSRKLQRLLQRRPPKSFQKKKIRQELQIRHGHCLFVNFEISRQIRQKVPLFGVALFRVTTVSFLPDFDHKTSCFVLLVKTDTRGISGNGRSLI